MTTAATRLALTALLLAPVGVRVARAQSPQGLSLRMDNDAFDFWMQPYNRPDEEYTSGVHITYDGALSPWWWWSFHDHGARCVYHIQDCHSSRAEVGQDMYTSSARVDDPRPTPGSRASGGWLYFAHSARSLHASRSDELTITLGVTGPPSLARFTQSVAHSVAPQFNRPADWTRQIRFEPGAIVDYEQRRRIMAYGRGAFGFDVLPSVSVDVGNVKTSADAGVQSRVGWNLPHPWLPESVPASVAVVGGVSARAVVRDIFLDGNTFHPDYRVGHEVLVGSGQIGVELRFRALSLAYRAVNETRSYAGGPPWHPWASIVGGVTFDR